MTDTLRITLAQLNLMVGDVKGNADRIGAAIGEAAQDGAQLVGEGDDAPPRPVRSLDDVVAEVERGEIENALRQTDGNRTRAAELLGINRRSLLRRLKKYGMAVEE